jgi:hypothetical protein
MVLLGDALGLVRVEIEAVLPELVREARDDGLNEETLKPTLEDDSKALLASSRVPHVALRATPHASISELTFAAAMRRVYQNWHFSPGTVFANDLRSGCTPEMHLQR